MSIARHLLSDFFVKFNGFVNVYITVTNTFSVRYSIAFFASFVLMMLPSTRTDVSYRNNDSSFATVL